MNDTMLFALALTLIDASLLRRIAEIYEGIWYRRLQAHERYWRHLSSYGYQSRLDRIDARWNADNDEWWTAFKAEHGINDKWETL